MRCDLYASKKAFVFSSAFTCHLAVGLKRNNKTEFNAPVTSYSHIHPPTQEALYHSSVRVRVMRHQAPQTLQNQNLVAYSQA